MAQGKDEQGAVFISAAGGWYPASTVDAGNIYEALMNGYLREQLEKASNKIFNGMYRVTVKDADGEELPELGHELEQIMEAPKVQMWARMKQAWEDIWSWGCSLQYPIWARDGNAIVLQELRRLPPESFAYQPKLDPSAISSELLPGILLNAKGELELWQTQDSTLNPTLLKPGCVVMVDPISTRLGGQSKAAYLVPIIKMIKFCWEAQMQKVNRIGAPIMFIKITGPASEEDKAYAQKILNNWGKGKAYRLRENMELVSLDVQDTDTALATISALEKRLEAPFRAGSTLDKEGATIGGNAGAQKESEDDWILGQRTLIEDCFEGLLQQYLDYNAYEGCRVEIEIAVETTQPGDLEIRQAQAGFACGAMSINEIRAKLGLPELSDEDIEIMLEERAKLQKAIGGTSPAMSQQMQENNPFAQPLDQVKEKAEVLGAITSIDPMDPERYITQEKAMAFLGLKKDEAKA
jgi:hypothetical protein